VQKIGKNLWVLDIFKNVHFAKPKRSFEKNSSENGFNP
jgi:hypothetical protein